MAWSSFRSRAQGRTSTRVFVYVAAGLSMAGLVARPAPERALAQGDAGVATSVQSARGEYAFQDALTRLKSTDSTERARAADELGQRGARYRLPISQALRPLLKSDPDSLVRAAAGRALGRLGVRDALPELVGALEDKSVEVRVVAAAALWRLPDPSAVPALLGCTDDADHAVREWSVLALGVVADPRAVPTLTRLLDDPQRAVRLAAVRSLGRIGNAAGLEPLLQYLKTDQRDDEEKDEVVSSLLSIAGSEREQALLRLLGGASGDPRQRVRVALALGKVGDHASVPALRKLASRDGTPAVRSAARQALVSLEARLGGPTQASANDAARP